MRKAHACCPPSIRCHKRRALPGYSPVTACHLPRSGGEQTLPAATPLRQDFAEPKQASKEQPFSNLLGPAYIQPVSPFVVAIVPGTTRKHANEAATALQRPRPAPAGSLLRPLSPATAFRSPGLPSQAPATKPAAIAAPALVMIFALRVTSLSGVTPRTPQPCASPSGPAQFPQARCLRFQGTEHGSIPLPIGYGFSRFGTVSRRTHWQALAGLSWLSYSQPRV